MSIEKGVKTTVTGKTLSGVAAVVAAIRAQGARCIRVRLYNGTANGLVTVTCAGSPDGITPVSAGSLAFVQVPTGALLSNNTPGAYVFFHINPVSLGTAPGLLHDSIYEFVIISATQAAVTGNVDFDIEPWFDRAYQQQPVG